MGGYSDIFYIYVGLAHFWGVQNFEFQYFWGFQKNEYCFWYEDFVFFLGGHFLCILGSFLKVNVHNGKMFLVC